MPSRLQTGSGPAPFRLPRGPRLQPVCPPPPPRYLFLIDRIPSALLPAPPRIIYFTSQNCLFSFLTSSRVTCAPLSLALLNPSLHSLFSSLDSTFPQYSPPPPSLPSTNLVPLLPPLVSDSQSLPPATLRSPRCLHPAPGHLSLSCSTCLAIGSRGLKSLSGCQETQISTPLTLSSSKSGMSLPSLNPSRSLSLQD